jgi:hypothetical protein
VCDFGLRMINPTRIALLVLAVASVSVSAVEPTEIPFRFTEGFVRVEVRIKSSSEPLSMLLDSGASVSVLNLDCARRLGLRSGKPIAIRGVACDSRAFEIEPTSASLAGVNSGEITLAADMSHADELCTEPIDGLIGVEFFRNRVVQIDYARKCLRLLTEAPPSSSHSRLPIRIINDVACAGVGVNGSSQRWARIDTGCNDALHWVVPKRARIAKPRGLSLGFVSDKRETALARVAIGKQTLESVPTVLHGQALFDGEAGLIGNELLSRFTVTLDWPGRSLILEGPKE